MRRLVPAFILAAVFGAWPGGSAGQEVSPDLAERLRAAVEGRADDAALATDLAQAPDLEPAELDELVAPVALYPDALLAQVLAAATYPDQVARAGEIVARGEEMSDAELEAAIAGEDWDPSVLALLSGFPTVIARMAEDLEGTTRLGAAMLHQDDGVLAAVQRMRLEAETAGNLVSNEAQTVEREGDVIAIRPTKPDVVYVPDYDPATVYSTRNAPAYVPTQPQSGLPGPEMLVSGALGFGAGFLVNELLADDDKGGGNGNGGKGWKDYWRQDRPIDWRERRFYPRPYRDRDWRADRDRYWDRSSGRWRRDDDLRRRDADERRGLAPWIVPANARDDFRSERELRAWREKARQEARDEARREARREWREEQRREARQDQRRDERREAIREDRREEERRAQAEARERAQAQERRAEARKDAERKAERAEERRKSERAEERRKAERAEERRKAERAEERRQAARAEERKQAARAEERRAAERRAEKRAEKRKEDRSQAVAGSKSKSDQKAKESTRKASARDDGERKRTQAQRREEPKRKSGGKKCGPDDNRKACRDG